MNDGVVRVFGNGGLLAESTMSFDPRPMVGAYILCGEIRAIIVEYIIHDEAPHRYDVIAMEESFYDSHSRQCYTHLTSHAECGCTIPS